MPFCLTRLNSDGTVDTSFGTDGTVLTGFQAAGAALPTCYLCSLDLQADGEVVAVGTAISANWQTSYPVLARYELGYTPVAEAGIGGADIAAPGLAYDLDLFSPDSGSTIGGWQIAWGDGDGDVQQIVGSPASVSHIYENTGDYTIQALAYVEGPGAGNLDQEHFGTNGSGTVVGAAGGDGDWLATSPATGEIFVSGYQAIYGYSAAGILENTIALPSGMTAFGPLAVEQNGSSERLIVANENCSGTTISLAAFNPATGSLESTFGASGIATLTLPTGDSLFEIDGVFVEPADGSIAVEGEFQVGSGFNYEIGLARFDAAGHNPGLALAIATMIDPNNGSGAAMDGNGNIVVTFAEMTGPSGNDSLAAVRYTASGIDPNFGTNGLFTLTALSAQSGGDAVAIQPDGSIVIGGSAWNLTDNCPALVVRLSSGGALDTTFNNCGYVLGPDFSTATARRRATGRKSRRGVSVLG